MHIWKIIKEIISSDFTVMIIPNTRKTTKQFKLNAFSTYAIVVAFLVLNVMISVTSVVYYSKSKSLDSENTYLSTELETNLDANTSLEDINSSKDQQILDLLSENDEVLAYYNQQIQQNNDLFIEMSNVIATFNEENDSDITIPVSRSLDRTAIQTITTYANTDDEFAELDINQVKEQEELSLVVDTMKSELKTLIDDIESELEYLECLPDHLPVEGRFSSGFGYRSHPLTGLRSFHYGIDLTTSRGTPIEAAGSGVVVFSGWSGGFGKVVIISHGYGYESVYAHNNSIYVEVGDQVVKGEVISEVGTTGDSTGPHLHFEIRVDGEAIDPTGVLKFEN